MVNQSVIDSSVDLEQLKGQLRNHESNTRTRTAD